MCLFVGREPTDLKTLRQAADPQALQLLRPLALTFRRRGTQFDCTSYHERLTSVPCRNGYLKRKINQMYPSIQKPRKTAEFPFTSSRISNFGYIQKSRDFVMNSFSGVRIRGPSNTVGSQSSRRLTYTHYTDRRPKKMTSVRALCAILALMVSGCSLAWDDSSLLHSKSHYVQFFRMWMRQHGVRFGTKGEFERRLQIFAENR